VILDRFSFLIGPNDAVCYGVTYIPTLLSGIGHRFKRSVDTLFQGVKGNSNIFASKHINYFSKYKTQVTSYFPIPCGKNGGKWTGLFPFCLGEQERGDNECNLALM